MLWGNRSVAKPDGVHGYSVAFDLQCNADPDNNATADSVFGYRSYDYFKVMLLRV